MRISDWSSYVCSSDLIDIVRGDEQDRSRLLLVGDPVADRKGFTLVWQEAERLCIGVEDGADGFRHARGFRRGQRVRDGVRKEAVHTLQVRRHRSEEHTSELQSLMRISYAVFCLKKKTTCTRVY